MPAQSANTPPKGRGSGRGNTFPPATRKPLPRITDEDIDAADQQVVRAFQILGLVANSSLICPACGTSKPKKVEAKISSAGRHYWTCHRCGAYGSATKLLRENGRKLPQAVNELLGRSTTSGPLAVLPQVTVAAPFNAVVDVEVYNAVRRLGSIPAAQQYYARWHISPEAIAEAGSTRIVEPAKAHAELLATFGEERVRDAGLLTTDRNGNDYWMFNDDYPVIEVHAWINANVTGMQFRPSERQLRKIQAHKAWKKRWSGHIGADGVELDASEAYVQAKALDPVKAGPEHKYVPPFMSVKGAGPDSLLGCGLRRIATLEPGQCIYVVEGFKDLLAARTLGVEAYAIPGVAGMPPAKVCQFFVSRGDTLIVTLDGDEAGARGRDSLMAHFATHNVKAERKDDLRPGMDIADILVETYAHNQCSCPTCKDWRDTHSWDPANCPCRTCRSRRPSSN
jgi:hypothetical protein